jgi:dTDP-4-amino-4,6-dideoxygalactose transaminase
VKLRDYLENHCRLQAVTGRLVSERSGRPVTAIVPVHLYGQVANMDAIMKLAAAYNLIVVEDACQAHGAQYFSQAENRWKKAGSIGHAAAFSFYPGKNLGACGEAGAVTTNSVEIAQKVRMMRDHGQARKYFHQMEGYNGRLDALQAAIMHVKLKHLAKWNEKRRAVAHHYAELLAPYAEWVVTPVEPSGSIPVYHLYVVRTRDRESLRETLAAANIGAGIHYPVPLHLQKAYARLGHRSGDFPVTEKVASEIISLPMYPDLTRDEQMRVVSKLAEHIERLRGSAVELAEI